MDARANAASGPKSDLGGMVELGRLISKWREADALVKVRSVQVIPDYSNRGHTGLSVEHVHYLASSFKRRGFIPRGSDKVRF